MATAILQETLHPGTTGSGQPPRFRPFASSTHHVTKGRYITSNDPRGYIPVYEYPLNNQWIMMDIDDGYILWTGIWKALGNSKADIVKMVDSQPELARVIRRVRGGYLKIQGTWMPFEVALRLARRVAWNIRDDLIPLFGPTFPSTCLSPDQPGYGQVVASSGVRRRARRVAVPAALQSPAQSSAPLVQAQIQPLAIAPAPAPGRSSPPQSQGWSPLSPSPFAVFPVPPSRFDPITQTHRRYAPYPSPSTNSLPPPARRSGSISLASISSHGSPQLPSLPPPKPFQLPAIHGSTPDRGGYALPPISALEDLPGAGRNDAKEVLRRLRADDESARSVSPAVPISMDIDQDEDEQRRVRRAVSVPTIHHPFSDPSSTSPQPQRRSLGQLPLPLPPPPPPLSHSPLSHSPLSHSPLSHSPHLHPAPPPLRLCVPVLTSGGSTTSDSAPSSPATPRSAHPERELSLVPLEVLKATSRRVAPYPTEANMPISISLSACRQSYVDDATLAPISPPGRGHAYIPLSIPLASW